MRDEPFAPEELAENGLLDGRVRLLQPVSGYRAGLDPVLLAASVPARAGQSVLELGCGGGPALCCLGWRVPGLDLAGVEIQPGYADLARRNLELNGLSGTIWNGDLAALPPALKARSFDHVIANPPYFEKARRTGADAADREVALAGETPLSDWVRTAARRLKPRGIATFIQRAERLPDLMSAMAACLGALELLPLAAREGRAPRLVLLRGRKEGRSDFRFHPPFVIHRGARHGGGRDDYSDAAASIVKGGSSLQFPA